MLVGYVDRIQDGELVGWAMDTAAPENPVLVTILVNGLAVASAVAAMLRGDVAKAHGTRGYHGFGVNLSRCIAACPEAQIDVRLPDGRRVKNAPITARIPTLPAAEPPPVIFMHIPKTAGTAFREAIELAYRPSERLHLYPDDTFYPRDFPIWQLPLDQRARTRFIAGHVGVGIHEALPNPVKYVTLLRDPFERVRSHYLHLACHAPEAIVVSGRQRTLTELLEQPTDTQFDNLMVRSFAGVGPVKCPPGAVNAAVLEAAIKNLRQHFSFVGFQAHAGAAYRRLRSMYGWNTRPELHRANVGGTSLPLADEATAREAAARREQWDMRLYEEASRLFPSD